MLFLSTRVSVVYNSDGFVERQIDGRCGALPYGFPVDADLITRHDFGAFLWPRAIDGDASLFNQFIRSASGAVSHLVEVFIDSYGFWLGHDGPFEWRCVNVSRCCCANERCMWIETRGTSHYVRDHWTGQSRVRAVLGPTNTGKTYTAIQRMLGHRNGIFGLPLRLLAREVYDRVVALKGPEAVALITGEEKIVPRKPRYYICTTESMPQELPVEFVAVDEVQLAAHPQRGHIFTDRILHARGSRETLFLGSKTIEPLLKQMVPDIDIEEKPRLSELTYSGYRKLTNLPPRSAVVAFSAERVVALAERLRAKYGGTAIVTGALSPRSRNAQVALYENGDVDYLVATDAIGMGLNLNVHHIALADDWKFDGTTNRPLRSDELAQIAGRAGRFRRNGTFGTTDQLQSLQPECVEAVCTHTFEPLRRVYWRSSTLAFGSVDALQDSLERSARTRMFVQKRDADDQLSLQRLAVRTRIRERAKSVETVQLLWDVWDSGF